MDLARGVLACRAPHPCQDDLERLEAPLDLDTDAADSHEQDAAVREPGIAAGLPYAPLLVADRDVDAPQRGEGKPDGQLGGGRGVYACRRGDGGCGGHERRHSVVARGLGLHQFQMRHAGQRGSRIHTAPVGEDDGVDVAGRCALGSGGQIPVNDVDVRARIDKCIPQFDGGNGQRGDWAARWPVAVLHAPSLIGGSRDGVPRSRPAGATRRNEVLDSSGGCTYCRKYV